MSAESTRPDPVEGPRPETEARPRALVVGTPVGWGDAAAMARALASRLEALPAGKDEVLKALGEGSPDIVFLDGYLPAETLTPVLEAVGYPGRADRPAVVVVTDEGRRTNVPDRLIDHADDFVNGRRGETVLFARVRVALRVRAAVTELHRKNAELESLYTRLEAMAGRMAEELRLASHVQRSLLPPPYSHPRLELAAEFIPVREIGGDYYDILPLTASRLALAIGDVMGKGVPAALLAANLKACLRAHLQAGNLAPEELIARVNRLFWEVTPKGLFASLFFGLFDFESGTLEYVNAGHDHPFRVRPDGTPECLPLGGTVLGLMEDSRYERGRLEILTDDLYVFYSDGLTDRADGEGQMYGVDRLQEAAARCSRDPARIVLYTLLGDVQGWSSGTPAEDDITLIVGRVR